MVAAVLALGACTDVDAGVTAGTAVAPAASVSTVVAPRPTVTTTLPAVTAPADRSPLL